MNCSVAQSLEIVGEWWTLLIIRDALLGVTKFDDFAARLGISRNVLTQRLDVLVSHEIMAKEPYQHKPARYHYQLTPKGRDLWTVISSLQQWGDRWAADDGAPVSTIHDTCGHTMTVEQTCSHCREPLQLETISVERGPGAGETNPLEGTFFD